MVLMRLFLGEYPQQAVLPELEIVLEYEYIRYNLVLIVKNYIFNNVKITINSSFDDNIKFLDKKYFGDFLETEMNRFIDKYMIKDLMKHGTFDKNNKICFIFR